MANVNPVTHIARVDEKARFSDMESTGTAYLAAVVQSGAQTVTGQIAANGGVKRPVVEITGDGAITIKDCVVLLSKGSAAAITLAAPTATTHDGLRIDIIAISAQAHVVTVTGAGGGSGQDVGTFGGAINDSTSLIAYNAKWYVIGAPRNVTWA